MATYEYYDIVGELIREKVISKEDVYDFEDSPRSFTYEKYFQFCQVNLSERCQDYNIQPAKFYFKEDLRVNANASFVKDHFVVAVNKGTIQSMYEFLYGQNDIFDEPDFSVYNQLNDILDVPLSYLMYQSASLFTYYHEQGFLIKTAGSS